MKKLSLLAALLLFLLLAVLPAQADAVAQMLARFGLSQSDAEAFAALMEETQGDLTDEEQAALLEDFLASAGEFRQKGTLEGDFYLHPLGFTLRVPSGWRVLEEQPGATVMLIGPGGEKQFAPTLSVLVLKGERPDFAAKTREEWDAYYGSVLHNYQSISLTALEYLDVPAHELVLTHGNDEASMLMQYQLYFNKDERAFIITLTTLAEEAADDSALEAYDSFLAQFTVLTGQGNG